MNLFAALMHDEQVPIGSLPWYGTVIPLVQLNFPAGTEIPPTLTCKEFLQMVMGLEPGVRLRILNTEIGDPKEELEAVKRDGHKSMLVAVVLVILVASLIIAAGYVAVTGANGGAPDKDIMSGFFNFIFELLKLFASLAGVELSE